MQNTLEKVEEMPYSTNKYINLACCVLEWTLVMVLFVPVMTIHLLIYVLSIPSHILSIMIDGIEDVMFFHTGFVLRKSAEF